MACIDGCRARFGGLRLRAGIARRVNYKGLGRREAGRGQPVSSGGRCLILGDGPEKTSAECQPSPVSTGRAAIVG